VPVHEALLAEIYQVQSAIGQMTDKPEVMLRQCPDFPPRNRYPREQTRRAGEPKRKSALKLARPNRAICFQSIQPRGHISNIATTGSMIGTDESQMSHLQCGLRQASHLTFLKVIRVKSVGWMLSLHQSCGIDRVRAQR
jgi:hypothetical protein